MIGIKYPIKIYRTVKRFKKNANESREVLSSFANIRTPELVRDYQEWASNRDNIGAVSAVRILGEEFCKFENQPYDEKQKKILTLSGGIARLVNDLYGGGIIHPEDGPCYLQTGKVDLTGDWRKKFGYELGLELERQLPHGFRETHQSLANTLNQTLVEGELLKIKETSREEIIRIRNLKGGIYNLAVYSFLFPQSGDPMSRLTSYVPNKEILPETKEQAIFNLGAFFTKADDFFDAKKDASWGIRQQVTEKILTKKDLEKEYQYAKTGLRKYYSGRTESFEELMETMLDTFRLTGILL